ncbi:MAG: DsbA family protein [Kofleriaceae bacterium]
MKKLALIAIVVGASSTLLACQQDNKNIERKLDQIIQKLDRLPAGGGAGAAAGAAQGRGGRPEPDRSKTYAVPVDNDPFDGPADAAVTIVKAYDYACPFCEKVRPTMDELHTKYGNDLRVVYKQLVVHPRNAMAGALAFCAAGKQGKHKDMDRLIWDKGFKVRQMDLSDVPPAEAGQGDKGQTQKCWDTAAGCTNVLAYASELQLNVEQFKADMKGSCVQSVQKDMKELQALGVGSTPAFFINGRYLSGAMPIENFSTLIDEELKKAKEKIQSGTPAAQYYQQQVLDKGLKSLAPG